MTTDTLGDMTNKNTLREEEKTKVDEKVSRIMFNLMNLHKIDKSEKNMKFAMAMFLSGVNFIPEYDK